MNQKRNNDELLTTVFGSKEVLEPAPTDVIPQGMMRPEIAYQIVKDETYPQTQPRLNLATFVTTYMDEYATRLMNEAISVNYIGASGGFAECVRPFRKYVSGLLNFVISGFYLRMCRMSSENVWRRDCLLA